MATGYSMSALVDKIEVIESLPEPDFHLPLENNLIITKGKGSPVQVDVSAAQDGSVMAPVPGLFQADFSRASKKTCVQNGQLVEVGIDEPAFEDEGILIEGSSTNLYIWSNDSDKWPVPAPPDRDIVKNYGISPSGEQNSTKYRRTVEQADYLGFTLGLLTQDSIYSFSGYIKKTSGIGTHAIFRVQTLYPARVSIWVDLASGEITRTENYTNILMNSKSDILDNGWIMVSISFKAVDISQSCGTVISMNDGNSSVTGVIGDELEVYGFQLEQLPFASSYIPTEGTAVTRASDIISFEWLHTNNMTYSMSADSKNTDNHVYFNSTGTNGRAIAWWRSSGRNIEWASFVNTPESNSKIYQNNPEIIHILTFSRSPSGYISYINGKQGAEAFNSDNPNFSATLFISDNPSDLYGHIKDFKIWNHALTPNQIAVIGAKK